MCAKSNATGTLQGLQPEMRSGLSWRPDAGFVRRKSGFAIGGVPPVGHREEPAAFVDEGLLGYGEVFASAGTHNAIFGLTPEELARMTAGRVAPVKV